MFNSQRINRDGHPWLDVFGHGRKSHQRYENDTYAPRPEFDNNPNPILERFRGTCETLTGGLCSTTQVEDELYLLGKADCAGLYEFTDRTLAHIDHAKRVLEKLVNVYG